MNTNKNESDPYTNVYVPTNAFFASFVGTGDAAWQQTASTLVGLQTLLGLVFIYGGLVKKKWAVNSMFMVVYAFSAALITWVLIGYSIAFGKSWSGKHGFFGKPESYIYTSQIEKQATLPSTYDMWFPGAYVVQPYFSMATMIYFQGMFCCICVCLIAGSLLCRMSFLAWMVFVPLWVIFSYCPGAFSMWAGGYFYKKDVLDFAGGYVIHVSAGTAGFVAAAIVGPRLQRDRAKFPPNNVILALGGAGVLWMGWNGFNGGATYNAMSISSIAILNTNFTTAISMCVWTICDYIYFGKPSVIGAIQGIITGLVGITPCAGFVQGWHCIIIGCITGTVPWFSMMVLGKKLWIYKKVDDTLGVIHTHGVTGFMGGLFAGLFSTRHLVVDHFALAPGLAGAFYGRAISLAWQVAAALFIIALNLIVTPLILYFIKYVLRIPLRMAPEHLEVGDNAAHGEEAYALFGDGTLDSEGWYDYEQTHHGQNLTFPKPPTVEEGKVTV